MKYVESSGQQGPLKSFCSVPSSCCFWPSVTTIVLTLYWIHLVHREKPSLHGQDLPVYSRSHKIISLEHGHPVRMYSLLLGHCVCRLLTATDAFFFLPA